MESMRARAMAATAAAGACLLMATALCGAAYADGAEGLGAEGAQTAPQLGFAYTGEYPGEGWHKVTTSQGSQWMYFYGYDDCASDCWEHLDGEWYHFASDGAMSTGWKQVDGTWYYFGESGKMRTGWQKLGGCWYYMGANGKMRTYWQRINGVWYWFGANGKMRTGWQKIDGKWYFFRGGGAMVTGVQHIGDKIYFFYGSGVWNGQKDAYTSGRYAVYVKYGQALSEILYNHSLPVLGVHEYTGPDGYGASFEYSKFAIKDVDGDSRPELVINWLDSCTAEFLSVVYDYYPSTGKWVVELKTQMPQDFYTSGYATHTTAHMVGTTFPTLYDKYQGTSTDKYATSSKPSSLGSKINLGSKIISAANISAYL